ncbi:hypothetical protein ALC56_14623 [Trachymyrmex septentrionalis]|uniref:Uncharacterized protein n=1 Tax=Trachymyrmex septentrionalis TaxID=34720 RepID=A0A195ESD2_9HYME|nr:hypothetical protein ALC56_14623 [Trachymyrmex septentrionalis]
MHCRLLELAPKLGHRVHFAEGTNLRCREDPIPSDSEIRSAVIQLRNLEQRSLSLFRREITREVIFVEEKKKKERKEIQSDFF